MTTATLNATLNPNDTATCNPLALEDLSDESLLLQYRETRDEELFAQLVRRYERPLFHYLRRYLGDAEMAEDVFQATFLKLHRKCDQFQEGRRLKPWLYRMATNQAIDATRRDRRHRNVSLNAPCETAEGSNGEAIDLLLSEEPAPHTGAEHEEHCVWMHRAVDALPDPLQRVVRLIYFQGLKYREAAEELSLPIGTVKSRAHKAIMRLNEAWLAQSGCVS